MVTEGQISRLNYKGFRKNDWRKVCIALEMRRNTTMNGDWISTRSKVGSCSSVPKAIEKYRREAEKEAPEK